MTLDRATVEQWRAVGATGKLMAGYYVEKLAEDWLRLVDERDYAVSQHERLHTKYVQQGEEEKPCADRNCTLPGDHEGQHFDARDGKWWT